MSQNPKQFLHRYITHAEKGQIIDHKDHNTLNNKKDNLILSTNKENIINSQLSSANKSGYKGVIWYPYHNYNKWKAFIRVDYKIYNLGFFDNIEDAAKVRKEAELKYFGRYLDTSISTEA